MRIIINKIRERERMKWMKVCYELELSLFQFPYSRSHIRIGKKTI